VQIRKNIGCRHHKILCYFSEVKWNKGISLKILQNDHLNLSISSIFQGFLLKVHDLIYGSNVWSLYLTRSMNSGKKCTFMFSSKLRLNLTLTLLINISFWIKKGLGNAALAGGSPVIGLYTCIFPVLLYVLIGAGPHMTMGKV